MKNRLPAWLKQDIPDEATFKIRDLLCEFGINTVCRQAKCPNITYCFRNKNITFMILGVTCTRNCRFCNIPQSARPASELSLNQEEPYRIAGLVKILGLKYVTVTSVCRDDLADGGAGQFAKTIELIHQVNKDIKVEVLIPDFGANTSSLKCVLDAAPFVTAHNIETVRRLYDVLRPQADYELSLEVLSKIKEIKPAMTTKSSLMLGLGETEEEVTGTMADLRKHECDILTLGQYLAPSELHYPVKEFIPIEQFRRYHKTALSMGFGAVLSGPCVRSSYQAQDLSKELMHA